MAYNTDKASSSPVATKTLRRRDASPTPCGASAWPPCLFVLLLLWRRAEKLPNGQCRTSVRDVPYCCQSCRAQLNTALLRRTDGWDCSSKHSLVWLCVEVSIGFTTRRIAYFSSPLVGPTRSPIRCGGKNFAGNTNLIIRYCRPYPRSGTDWNCCRVHNTLCWSLCHWAGFCLSTLVSPSQWHVTNAVYSSHTA